LEIWDLTRREIRSFCKGSRYFVAAAAFSPDAALLASGGRFGTRLWDVASGKLVLSLAGNPDAVRGLAFTPDGRRLVAASRILHQTDMSYLFQLEEGRGIRTLRGLTESVMHLGLNLRRRLIAAISEDMTVGLWDLDTGRLRYVRDPSRILASYTTGLTFSPEGDRLVVNVGCDVELWDVDSGRTLRRWTLPEGLFDNFAFPETGGLIAVRLETRDGRAVPFGNTDPHNPNVFRVRNLLAPPAQWHLKDITGYESHIHETQLTPDARLLTVRGVRTGEKQERISLATFDVATGRVVWSVSDTGRDIAELVGSPRAGILGYGIGDPPETKFLERATGRAVGSWSKRTTQLGPGWLNLAEEPETPGDPNSRRVRRLRRGEDQVLFNLLPELMSRASGPIGFSDDGRYLIWGNVDGTISVCDIDQSLAELGKLGLRAGLPEEERGGRE
jgi:WD40 repeat protein